VTKYIHSQIKYLYLCNGTYISERKVTQRGSILVSRKMLETIDGTSPSQHYPQQQRRSCVCQHIHKTDAKSNAGA